MRIHTYFQVSFLQNTFVYAFSDLIHGPSSVNELKVQHWLPEHLSTDIIQCRTENSSESDVESADRRRRCSLELEDFVSSVLLRTTEYAGNEMLPIELLQLQAGELV